MALGLGAVPGLPVDLAGASLAVTMRVEKDLPHHLAGLTAAVTIGEGERPDPGRDPVPLGRAGEHLGAAGRPGQHRRVTGPGASRAAPTYNGEVSPTRRRRTGDPTLDDAAATAPDTVGTTFADLDEAPLDDRGTDLDARRAGPRRGPLDPGARRRSSGPGRPSQGACRADRPRPQPGTGTGRHDHRRSVAHPGRGRFGQDPRPRPPDRLSRRRPRRCPVADPGGHVHQPRGGGAARADHLADRRARPRRRRPARSIRSTPGCCARTARPSGSVVDSSSTTPTTSRP